MITVKNRVKIYFRLLLIKKEKFMSQRGITINDMQFGQVNTDLDPKSYGRTAGVRHTP